MALGYAIVLYWLCPSWAKLLKASESSHEASGMVTTTSFALFPCEKCAKLCHVVPRIEKNGKIRMENQTISRNDCFYALSASCLRLIYQLYPPYGGFLK